MNRVGVSLLTIGILFPAALHAQGAPAAPLVVHEWGTITTRHAPDGTPQGRLNRIAPSQVLPDFVHRYEPPATQNTPEKSTAKTTLTPGRPDVTMRLETPVIYFYPPRGVRASSIPPFDVTVRFRGGIVNEFYPAADASVEVDVERVNVKMQEGILKAWDGEVLNNYVVGGLRWTGISLGDSVRVRETSSNVWLAPRRVRSAGVTARSGEGERYLFYRGVAHLDAVVRTELSATDVRVLTPRHLQWLPRPSMTIPHLWLVDIRSGGRVAFRAHDRITVAKAAASSELARLPLFADAEYSTAALAELRRSMKQALTESGLFDDEAVAMLETWKASYFGGTGLRIFYVVPAVWTTYFLPLQISAPHALTRVLVGRIDLANKQ